MTHAGIRPRRRWWQESCAALDSFDTTLDQDTATLTAARQGCLPGATAHRGVLVGVQSGAEEDAGRGSKGARQVRGLARGREEGGRRRGGVRRGGGDGRRGAEVSSGRVTT